MFRTIPCLSVYSKAFRNLHSQIHQDQKLAGGCATFSHQCDQQNRHGKPEAHRLSLSAELLGGAWVWGSPSHLPGVHTVSCLVKWGQWHFMELIEWWWGSYLKIKLFQMGSILNKSRTFYHPIALGIKAKSGGPRSATWQGTAQPADCAHGTTNRSRFFFCPSEFLVSHSHPPSPNAYPYFLDA